jgi:pyoverdine/dityrosine biosynthesis protein Dit1
VGIPDEDTWAYSESLMEMAAREGSTSLKLLRVMDLLGLTAGETTTKDMYLSMTDVSRKALLEQYGRSEAEVREMLQTDEDILLTYRGFIRFLETDLK